MAGNKLIIEAGSRSFGFRGRELLEYRDLFYMLAWRDVRVRYAQTILGLLWAVLQPLVTLGIFVVIFGRALKVDSGEVPYAVFALSGMLGWSYFSYVLQQSGSSIIGAQEMVKKIYFPRLIIPLSKSITGFVDLLITFIFLIILMVYYSVPVGSGIIVFFPAFLLLLFASLGAGIWMSALTIRYRDFQHVIPFVVQVGMYASPIAYPSTLIPSKWAWIYYLNPMAGITDLFRSGLFGLPLQFPWLWLSAGMSILLFVSGLMYFRKMERLIADII